MSRLDSVIRRLSAQRDCLGWAVANAPAGAVLDLGLGNGRTYHHLREIAPKRDVYVIDRRMAAHPSSVPPDEFFLEGEAEPMIETLAGRVGNTIALAHYDLGNGVPENDVPLAKSIAGLLPTVLADGAIIVANAEMDGFEQLPTPEGVAEGRYFIQRYSV